MTRKKKSISAARSLRKRDVPAEALLWKALRNRALGGFKFRRQHPIGSYVVDFGCIECKVAVEIDGTTHLTKRAKDDQRSSVLVVAGWRVLRFWNTQVYDELDAVKEAIYRECVKREDPHLVPLTLALSPRHLRPSK